MPTKLILPGKLAMPLVLRLFGALQATWDDKPLKFATEHTRALLAYLAVETDVAHPRTTLATLLWPEENEARARHNLRQALFFLKQGLGAVAGRDAILHVTPTTLQWNSKGIEVDLHAFQQRWKLSRSHNHANTQQCPTCLEYFTQAITLYQGEFLQGLLPKECQPFEEWVLFLREQCHREAMAMLDALVTHYMAVDDYEQAQRYAARQVALEPWHEEGHRHLMKALALQGQQSAALRQYESCRRLLQQELGVPPSLETTTLYEQIRVGNFGMVIRRQDDKVTEQYDRPPTPSPLHNLPASLPPLVGRSQELEQLSLLIGNATQRLMTIVGMGGMGKSRLALALLQQLLAESPAPFAHGVWFVPVISVPSNADELPDALAGATFKALGITPPHQESLPRALFHHLAQRQLLLIFDSFEHLLVEESAAAATEFILALLHAAPGVILVVTSRLPLQLLAETMIRLEGLSVPPRLLSKVDKRDAANYESVRLFIYHAQRTLPSFTLSDNSLAAVIELCRALSGMPLAIELAAALVPHFTPSEMVAAIHQNLELLVSQRRDLDARHRHFSAVLESSWQLLPAREQAILAQCSVFAGPFSRAAAQAVTGATVSELASLVDKSLIQQPGVGIYQLHDLLRQFAYDKFHSDGEVAAAVADRHSHYYLNFVAMRERMLTRDRSRQAVEEIQQEVDNVRQAWAWAVRDTGQLPSTAALCARLDASAYGLWHFYLIAGLNTEGIAAFQQASAGVEAALTALSASLGTEASAEAALRPWQQLLSKLWALKAYMLCTGGDYSKALTIAKQAIAMGATCDSKEGEAIGLLAVAQVCYHNGAPDEAKAYVEQTLQLVYHYPWSDEPPEFCYDVQLIAYLYLGVIALNADDYEQARSQITMALQLCQRLGKLRGEMHARMNLANLARYKQSYASARQDYLQALQLAGELGYRRGEAMARYELADILRGLGEYGPALEQYMLALAILREIGDTFHEDYAQVDVGRLYAYLGDYGRAQELIHQTLLRSQHFAMLDARLDSLLAMALLHQLVGEQNEALHYATLSHQVARKGGSRRYEGFALLYTGNALEGLARWPEASAAYTSALQLYQQLGIEPVMAEAQAGLARTALAEGDLALALTWVEKTLAILEDLPSIGLNEPFQIYLTCYHTLMANADPRALAVLQRGVQELFRYAERIPDHELRCSFLENVPVHRELQHAYTATLDAAEATR